MKKISKRIMVGIFTMALTVGTLGFVGTTEVRAQEDSGTPMYRLYNSANGEHLYTLDSNEKNVLTRQGWTYEGYSWIAYNEGKPVYRFFNMYSGEHHYTMDENEKAYLIDIGWNYEGIGWYSNNTGSECEVPIYRLFCPFTNEALKSHIYTMDKSERDYLLSIGWNDEGICWNSMHNVINGSIVEPTCANTGYSSGATCKVCYKSYDGVVLTINPNNHIHTSYVPESTMIIDRGTALDRCSFYTCKICGEEIWRTGDEYITGLGFDESCINHLNEKHGFQYHHYQDVEDGIITDDEFTSELDEVMSHFNQQIISGYIDTVVVPAHFRCNDCGRVVF